MAPATCYLSFLLVNTAHTQGYYEGKSTLKQLDLVVSQFDVLSHTSMHAQCKTIAVLRHLPLSKHGRATVVADSLSIHQASGYNTSCMVVYACAGLAIF